MVEIKIFGVMPPCANCKRAERQALKAAEKFGGLVKVIKCDALGPEVKFVGLAPSKESLIGALRETGLE